MVTATLRKKQQFKNPICVILIVSQAALDGPVSESPWEVRFCSYLEQIKHLHRALQQMPMTRPPILAIRATVPATAWARHLQARTGVLALGHGILPFLPLFL